MRGLKRTDPRDTVYEALAPTEHLRKRGNRVSLIPNDVPAGKPTLVDWVELDYPSIPYRGEPFLSYSNEKPLSRLSSEATGVKMLPESLTGVSPSSLRLVICQSPGGQMEFQTFPPEQPEAWILPLKKDPQQMVLFNLEEASEPTGGETVHRTRVRTEFSHPDRYDCGGGGQVSSGTLEIPG